MTTRKRSTVLPVSLSERTWILRRRFLIYLLFHYSIVQSIATLVAGFIIGLIFAWKLGLVGIACTPLLVSAGYIRLVSSHVYISQLFACLMYTVSSVLSFLRMSRIREPMRIPLNLLARLPVPFELSPLSLVKMTASGCTANLSRSPSVVQTGVPSGVT